jgi:hypothetical protein
MCHYFRHPASTPTPASIMVVILVVVVIIIILFITLHGRIYDVAIVSEKGSRYVSAER